MAIFMNRTWTASIQIETRRGTVTMPATDSDADLLRDQIQTAVREAAVFVDDEEARAVSITIWKFTQARGLEADRQFMVGRDKRGRIYYQ